MIILLLSIMHELSLFYRIDYFSAIIFNYLLWITSIFIAFMS
ncbi:hypothetical protein A1OE_442 [Candidatus Endolissoclinum faulkneri L2]|uniref:Uncharacterized protein n=1 Tax=Candidatus Endolissoclinum faulkneri L2 TaxID=1193729 RepID=K7YGA2_9PROT|nr:hypothetical protein A1OE_442 [Candidatus Endolissoclinum faulkneri L2]